MFLKWSGIWSRLKPSKKCVTNPPSKERIVCGMAEIKPFTFFFLFVVVFFLFLFFLIPVEIAKNTHVIIVMFEQFSVSKLRSL